MGQLPGPLDSVRNSRRVEAEPRRNLCEGIALGPKLHHLFDIDPVPDLRPWEPPAVIADGAFLNFKAFGEAPDALALLVAMLYSVNFNL